MVAYRYQLKISTVFHMEHVFLLKQTSFSFHFHLHTSTKSHSKTHSSLSRSYSQFPTKISFKPALTLHFNFRATAQSNQPHYKCLQKEAIQMTFPLQQLFQLHSGHGRGTFDNWTPSNLMFASMGHNIETIELEKRKNQIKSLTFSKIIADSISGKYLLADCALILHSLSTM